MKMHWGENELAESWTLNELELKWVFRHTGSHRFGFAAQLKFFQVDGRFPSSRKEIPTVAVNHLARQLRVSPKSFSRYSYVGRTAIRDRVLIRDLLGFRQPTTQDVDALTSWLNSDVFPVEHGSDDLYEAIVEWYRQQRIELPSKSRLERIVSSAERSVESKFYTMACTRIPLPCFIRMNELLNLSNPESSDDVDRTPMSELRAEPGLPNRESVMMEIAKLVRIDEIDLPEKLFRSYLINTALGSSHRQGG